MKRMWTRVAALVALAPLVGLAVAALTVGPTPSATAAPVVAVSAQAGDRLYVFPSDERQAFDACVTAEREARGIPGNEAAYRMWWTANQGTAAEQDWSAAFDQCVNGTLWQRGKWNWDNMILVSGG